MHLPSYDYLQVIWFVRGPFSSQTGGLGGEGGGASTRVKALVQGSHIAFLSFSGVVWGSILSGNPEIQTDFQQTVPVKLEVFKNGTGQLSKMHLF